MGTLVDARRYPTSRHLQADRAVHVLNLRRCAPHNGPRKSLRLMGLLLCVILPCSTSAAGTTESTVG